MLAVSDDSVTTVKQSSSPDYDYDDNADWYIDVLGEPHSEDDSGGVRGVSGVNDGSGGARGVSGVNGGSDDLGDDDVAGGEEEEEEGEEEDHNSVSTVLPTEEEVEAKEEPLTEMERETDSEGGFRPKREHMEAIDKEGEEEEEEEEEFANAPTRFCWV